MIDTFFNKSYKISDYATAAAAAAAAAIGYG